MKNANDIKLLKALQNNNAGAVAIMISNRQLKINLLNRLIAILNECEDYEFNESINKREWEQYLYDVGFNKKDANRYAIILCNWLQYKIKK